MNTVGPDKRLQYYRLPGAAVLTSLRSHAMGLTNAEAERRQAANGPNAIVDQNAPRRWRAAYGVAALLLFDTLLAGAAQDQPLSFTFFALAILSVAIGRWEVRRDYRPAVQYSRLLPARAAVLRNGTIRTIRARKLVVGDIVQLEAGDVVPADLRLLAETDLLIDDAMVLGGNTHTRKFTHAIRSAVPLLARNNLAFAGTMVVRGQASGLVVATGIQTELGRLSALESSARQAWPRSHQDPHRWLNAAAGALFVVFLFLAWQAGATPVQTLQLTLILLAAFLPFGVLLANHFLVWRAETKLGALGIHIAPAALRRFDTVDMLFLHDRLITPPQFTADSFMIGRSQYVVAGSGHRPIGTIHDSTSRALSDQQLRELSLFFAAGALTTHTSVTNHPSQTEHWQVRGDALEAALVTLARKARLSVEQLAVDYEPVAQYPYDHGRELASTVCVHDGKIAVLVRGTPEAVLSRSQKIWDHGHVRALSDHDRARFMAFAGDQKDRVCLALAYRALPDNEAVPSLEEAENNLTLLGIVSCALSSPEAVAHLHTTLPASTHVVRLDTHPYSPDAVSGRRLRKLSDDAVLELLHTHARFAGLAGEDVLRLVEVAKQAGHTVGVSGLSLADQAALQHADVSLAGPMSAGVVRQHAAIVLDDTGVSPLITLLAHIRALAAQRLILRRAVTADLLAALFIVLAGLRSVLYINTPPALTGLEIVIGMLLAQSLPLFSLTKVAAQRRSHLPRSEVVWFALATAVLTYGNFLAFFWRHGIGAAFIDAGSSYYLQATTIALLTLVTCQWLHAVFEQYDGARIFLGNLVFALPVIGILLLAGLTYLPFMNNYLGTRPLDPSDWLSVALAGAVYVGIRAVQRHTRHHSRAAVVQLHKATFGQSRHSL